MFKITFICLILLVISSKIVQSNESFLLRNDDFTDKPDRSLVRNEEWHYDNTHGGDWNFADAVCLTGNMQSPIDVPISVIVEENSKLLDITYLLPDATKVRVENNGHYIISYANWMKFSANALNQANTYTAVQTHFHSPGEHTFDGTQVDLEMHIVTKVDTKKDIRTYGVFTFIFNVEDTANDNPIIKPFADGAEQLAATGSDSTEVQANFESAVKDQFQYLQKKSYITYEGSLTTPNCDEIVNFYIIDELLPISREQYKIFRSISTVGNYRVTLPLNGRKIARGKFQINEQISYGLNFKFSIFLVCVSLLAFFLY